MVGMSQNPLCTNQQRLEKPLGFMVFTTEGLNRVSQAITTSREGRGQLHAERQTGGGPHAGSLRQQASAIDGSDTTLRETSEVLDKVTDDLAPSEAISEVMMVWTEQWSWATGLSGVPDRDPRTRCGDRTHFEGMQDVAVAAQKDVHFMELKIFFN